MIISVIATRHVILINHNYLYVYFKFRYKLKWKSLYMLYMLKFYQVESPSTVHVVPSARVHLFFGSAPFSGFTENLKGRELRISVPGRNFQ